MLKDRKKLQEFKDMSSVVGHSRSRSSTSYDGFLGKVTFFSPSML